MGPQWVRRPRTPRHPQGAAAREVRPSFHAIWNAPDARGSRSACRGPTTAATSPTQHVAPQSFRIRSWLARRAESRAAGSRGSTIAARVCSATRLTMRLVRGPAESCVPTVMSVPIRWRLVLGGLAARCRSAAACARPCLDLTAPAEAAAMESRRQGGVTPRPAATTSTGAAKGMRAPSSTTARTDSSARKARTFPIARPTGVAPDCATWTTLGAVRGSRGRVVGGRSTTARCRSRPSWALA